MSEPCYEFAEHPGWRSRPAGSGGVTWDGWCSGCGFRIDDEPFDMGRGVGISGNGRRLAKTYQRITLEDGQQFTSDKGKIYCSECVPSIK